VTVHLHATTCPHCGRVNPLASNWKDQTGHPEDGDFTFCITCHLPAVFDEASEGGLRALTEADAMALGEVLAELRKEHAS
jgi:hypothetical protein